MKLVLFFTALVAVNVSGERLVPKQLRNILNNRQASSNNDNENKPNVVEQALPNGLALLINTDQKKIVGVAKDHGQDLNLIGNLKGEYQGDGNTLLIDQDDGTVAGVLGRTIPVIPVPIVDADQNTESPDALGNVFVVYYSDNKRGYLVNRDNGAVLGTIETTEDGSSVDSDYLVVEQNQDKLHLVDKLTGDIVGTIGRLVEVISEYGVVSIVDRNTDDVKDTTVAGVGYFGNPHRDGSKIAKVLKNVGSLNSGYPSYVQKSSDAATQGSNTKSNNHAKQNEFNLLNQGNVNGRFLEDDNLVIYNSETGKPLAVKRQNGDVKFLGNLDFSFRNRTIFNRDTSAVEGVIGDVLRVERPGLKLLKRAANEKLYGIVADDGSIFDLSTETVIPENN